MSYCFVTPSYRGDFHRCRMQVESLHQFDHTANHYIVVDPCDMAMFRPLAAPRTIIVDAREVMHPAHHPMPVRNLWISRRGSVVRGWIVQQLVKLGMAAYISEEIQINLDSDVALLRPFDIAEFMDDDRLALFEINWTNEENRSWAKISRRLLGLPASVDTTAFVGPLIPWRRSIVTAMTAQISAVGGDDWRLQLGRERTFSEYMLYGIYAREALGMDQARLYSSARDAVLQSYGSGFATAEDVDRFVGKLAPSHVAAMLHSKDGVAIDRHRDIIDRLRCKVGEMSHHTANIAQK